MVLDYNTPPPRGFKPSDEAFEFWDLAISLGYPYSKSKPYFYNQDYRSADNMQHAKEFAIANQQTTTTTTGRNKKGDTVFSSFEPTVTLGDVITNIADTIIPSIPEAEATGIHAPDTDTGGFYYGPSEADTTTTTPSSTTLPPFAGTIEHVLSKTAPLLPRLLISNITKNSAIINWNSGGDGGSQITNWHYLLKNKDNNQTIKEKNFNAQEVGTLEMNLIPGTNYKAYIIATNAFGNSDENGISFKTLGSVPIVETPEPEPTPQPTPEPEVEIPPIPELPPQLETESCQQYRTRVANLGHHVDWLSPCPETVSTVPGSNSYDIKLTSASYMGTDKGKTVNIQASINLTGAPVNSIHARIQIEQKLSGTVIYQNFQNLSVGGGKTFPLVFNIPDLGKKEEGISGGEATAKIHYKILLWESLENPIALTPFPLIGDLTYDSGVIIPDPETGKEEVTTSLLGKFMGVTALIGTLALLGSKGR